MLRFLLILICICVLSPEYAFAQVEIGPVAVPWPDHRAHISWVFTGQAPNTITITAPDGSSSQTPVSTNGDVASVEVRNMQPGVRYSALIPGANISFVSPGTTDDVHFAVYGDCRSGHVVHQRLVSGITALHPDFVLLTGDLVSTSWFDREWVQFFRVAQPLTSTTLVAAVRGNHDTGSSRIDQFFSMEGSHPSARPTFGSFDWGSTHIVLIDTEEALHEESEQYRFLDQDLSNHQTTGPLIAVLHRALFSSSNHGGEEAYDIRPYLGRLFQKHGVDLVIQGHDHVYERTQTINGVTYITSGGGGAPLYTFRKQPWSVIAESVFHFIEVTSSRNSIRVKALRLDGTLIDEFVLDPQANNHRFTGLEPLPYGGGKRGLGCRLTPGVVRNRGTILGFFAFIAVVITIHRRMRSRKHNARAKHSHKTPSEDTKG